MTTDNDRGEIQKWLDGNGIKRSQVTWYTDKESGATLRRPGFVSERTTS
jgi:hypothetical protein